MSLLVIEQTIFTEAEILAVGYIIEDVCEGCLLDNLLCSDPNGNYYIFREKALNCWSSALELLPYSGDVAFDYWYENFIFEEE